MKKLFITLLIGGLLHLNASSQWDYFQYFDGADTSSWNSLIMHIDTNADNIWQIGPPQKGIFDLAATVPNVIVTDTINFYSPDNNSVFSFSLYEESFYPGILAMQWKQKLDMSSGQDGGIIEFWNGQVGQWQNVFNNPYVYAFYGYLPENADTLQNGEHCFSGTDSAWRDIWLCFDINWLTYLDTLKFKYTFKSDEVAEEKEGWMMDNFMAHVTIIHSVNEKEQFEYVDVWPNPTQGRISINTRKSDDFHIIEKLELYNILGTLLQSFEYVPTRFFIDISDYPDGVYFLRVETNKKTETKRLVLQH